MNFEDIRPYYDHEVHEKIKGLVEEPQFQQVIEQINPGLPYELFKKQMLSIQNVKDFQRLMVVPMLDKLLKKSTDGLSFDGIENLEKGVQYLFVSTHRDIVLDSALMNYVLLSQGFETAEIAIGDNLMKIPWIVDLVKLNKSFIVKRDLPKEKKVEGSVQLSSYINDTIKNKGESIWIAQKSGRSKDGNDRTNPSLLKMFNLGGQSSTAFDNLKQLNICPVSISYEYNPCDALTMPELMLIAQGGKYEKQPMEDIVHMGQGIEGKKGKVVVSFGVPFNKQIDQLKGITNRNDLLSKAAQLIDREIHRTYHLMPTNYIAHDVLKKEDGFAAHYSMDQKKSFLDYMKQRIKSVEGDESYKKEVFLKMYAYPVMNRKSLD